MLANDDVFDILVRYLSELKERNNLLYEEHDEQDNDVPEALEYDAELLERDDAIYNEWLLGKQTRCKRRKQRRNHSRDNRGTLKAWRAWHSSNCYERLVRERLRRRDQKVSLKHELDEFFDDRMLQEEEENAWAYHEKEKRRSRQEAYQYAWDVYASSELCRERAEKANMECEISMYFNALDEELKIQAEEEQAWKEFEEEHGPSKQLTTEFEWFCHENQEQVEKILQLVVKNFLLKIFE